jgi:phosphomannomutase
MNSVRSESEASNVGIRKQTLGESLCYSPVQMRFGTSGRRGLLKDLTQLEVYINARGELEYLKTLCIENGGIQGGDAFYIGHDLRPSSTRFSNEHNGRGEIAQAIVQAIRDAGLRPVNLGAIPTPALMYYATERRCGSIMVTGSHIPFDRNGYKTNSSTGEFLKTDEAPVESIAAQIRQQVYDEPLTQSLFDARGMFKDGHRELPSAESSAAEAYLKRHLDFFEPSCLKGLRIMVYEHSAVGRELLGELLGRLGADVIRVGRSETFLPIDTENINEAQLAAIHSLVKEVWEQHGPIDAVVSTDGDSDRPLLLAVEPAAHSYQVRFYGGDLVGMVVAEYLRADAVVVPVTCNDAVERGVLRSALQPRTRIGSPYVIAGMQQARRMGATAVCGWEANGGFLTGSDLTLDGRRLRALPTRDAFLPILAVLRLVVQKQTSLSGVFDQLPKRFSCAGLLPHFCRATSLAILQELTARDDIVEVLFYDGTTLIRNRSEASAASYAEETTLRMLRQRLRGIFNAGLCFGDIKRINYTDGIRLWFSNGDIVHVRASGNADELRIYAVADTLERAQEIVAAGLAEPDGILRTLERSTLSRASSGYHCN